MPKTKQNNGLSYTEGFDAWTAGKSLKDCPYSGPTREAVAWREGFEAAKRGGVPRKQPDGKYRVDLGVSRG